MDKLKLKDLYQLREWVDQMYWDFDRLSSSGQETLDKIADKLGMETETTEDVVNRVSKSIKDLKEQNPTWTNEKLCSEVLKFWLDK
jgi:arsenate reductase-like glutaredoxin family protein